AGDPVAGAAAVAAGDPVAGAPTVCAPITAGASPAADVRPAVAAGITDGDDARAGAGALVLALAINRPGVAGLGVGVLDVGSLGVGGLGVGGCGVAGLGVAGLGVGCLRVAGLDVAGLGAAAAAVLHARETLDGAIHFGLDHPRSGRRGPQPHLEVVREPVGRLAADCLHRGELAADGDDLLQCRHAHRRAKRAPAVVALDDVAEAA